MPLYQYICETCGQPFEQMIPFNKLDTKPECPNCHSPNTRKQLSTFAVRGGRSTASSSSCGSGGGGRFT